MSSALQLPQSERFAAHRFYLRQRFGIKSHQFSRPVE